MFRLLGLLFFALVLVPGLPLPALALLDVPCPRSPPAPPPPRPPLTKLNSFVASLRIGYSSCCTPQKERLPRKRDENPLSSMSFYSRSNNGTGRQLHLYGFVKCIIASRSFGSAWIGTWRVFWADSAVSVIYDLHIKSLTCSPAAMTMLLRRGVCAGGETWERRWYWLLRPQ